MTKSIFGNTDIYIIDQILKDRYLASDKILDAGCGDGRNLPWFINSSIVNNGKIIVLNVGNDDFGDRAFDVLNGSHFHNTSAGELLIKEAKGTGIRLETGSTVENDGDILVEKTDPLGIYVSSSSSFTNRNIIDVNSTRGIGVQGTFTNLGSTKITVSSDPNLNAISMFTNGLFINENEVIIEVLNASAIFIGTGALIHHKSGTIQINLTSANGIRSPNGELRVDPGAVLEINDSCSEFYLQIDSSAIFDCQGILDIGN